MVPIAPSARTVPPVARRAFHRSLAAPPPAARRAARSGNAAGSKEPGVPCCDAWSAPAPCDRSGDPRWFLLGLVNSESLALPVTHPASSVLYAARHLARCCRRIPVTCRSDGPSGTSVRFLRHMPAPSAGRTLAGQHSRTPWIEASPCRAAACSLRPSWRPSCSPSGWQTRRFGRERWPSDLVRRGTAQLAAQRAEVRATACSTAPVRGRRGSTGDGGAECRYLAGNS
jgi:hypothetical protein